MKLLSWNFWANPRYLIKKSTYLNWKSGFLQNFGGSISKDDVSPFPDVGGGLGGSSLSSMIPSSDPKEK